MTWLQALQSKGNKSLQTQEEELLSLVRKLRAIWKFKVVRFVQLYTNIPFKICSFPSMPCLLCKRLGGAPDSTFMELCPQLQETILLGLPREFSVSPIVILKRDFRTLSLLFLKFWSLQHSQKKSSQSTTIIGLITTLPVRFTSNLFLKPFFSRHFIPEKHRWQWVVKTPLHSAD